MPRRYKILTAVLAGIAVAITALLLVLSHDSPCRAAPPPAGNAPLMQAILYRCYGAPDVLRLESVPRPALADDAVLVRVQAASVNPLDWHYMRGQPYIMRFGAGLGRPTDMRLGVDFAGTVAAVGKAVRKFKPGDPVFGGAAGAFAQYVVVRESRALALKPPNVSFEQAAAVPIAGLTALQALRDKGGLRPGQHVLVNGASGGVGTFAVQIAKALGADVTGVCSTRNVAMVRALGADHVIDYTREDFTQAAARYDLIIDNVGSHPLSHYRRVLQPQGTLVMVGGQSGAFGLGFLYDAAWAALTSHFVGQKLQFFLAQLNADDLRTVADLMQSGKVTPVIDRRYPLSEAADAIRYVETGRARGKVIIEIADPAAN